MEGSFEEYVTARGDALLRFAYVLSGDRHLAEDLVQEVLARIHRRWHRMAEVEQPDAYLRRAIVRQFISWRRRRASSETPTDRLPELESPVDTATRQAAQDEMWRLLATLPRKQRAVLVLRFYEDLPDTEIADVLGCRQTTVRVHASRGLARLRQLLSSSSVVAKPIGGRL
ncbi:MAG TPA: SigE family RNA polymerase sigma factor [Natronosporangium sp.]